MSERLNDELKDVNEWKPNDKKIKWYQHCWLRLIAHDWTPWKLQKEDRKRRLYSRECKRCWMEGLKWDWKI